MYTWGILVVGAVTLGIRSRHARSEYNESKFILIAMYNSSFAGAVLVILYAIQINDRILDFIIR